MSADNGVYILFTEGPEYRVRHTQAIDNIYGKYHDSTLTWSPNVDMIIECFGESQVFNDLTDAYDYAYSIDEDIGYSEDGVCLISEFSNYSFSDFEDEHDRRIKNEKSD